VSICRVWGSWRSRQFTLG